MSWRIAHTRKRKRLNALCSESNTTKGRLEPIILLEVVKMEQKPNLVGMSPQMQARLKVELERGLMAEREQKRLMEEARMAAMEPPQGIDSEESMTVTEAEIEEAKQAIRRRRPKWRGRTVRTKGGVSGKPRARPSGPPVYFSLETGQPIQAGAPGEIGTVIEEEVRTMYAEIAELERQAEQRRSYITLLMQGSKRMASKTRPPAPTLQEINETEGEKGGPVPGTLAYQTIEVLRKEGRPLYIAELARLMGYHGPKRKNALLGSVSSYASKGKYGIIRTAPSVYALAEWGKVKQL